MEPGTKIKLKSSGVAGSKYKREVKFFGDAWVVYTVDRGDGKPAQEYVTDRIDFGIKFAEVPDFFEEGKTYYKNDPTSRYSYTFEVKSVDKNEGEGMGMTPYAAYGLMIATLDGKLVRKEWTVFTNITWDSRNWSEIQGV